MRANRKAMGACGEQTVREKNKTEENGKKPEVSPGIGLLSADAHVL